MNNENKNQSLVNNEFDKLSHLRKIRHVAFLSDLEMLSRRTGCCYASNEYFQLRSKNVLTGSSIATITRTIRVLKASEFITVEKKNGNRREIRLTLRGHNILREYGFLNFDNENRNEINPNEDINDSIDDHSDHSKNVIDNHSDQSDNHSDHVNDHSDHSIDYSNYNNHSILHKIENQEKLETNNINISFLEKEKLVVTKKSGIKVDLEGRRGPTAEQYAQKINTLDNNSLSNLMNVLNFVVAL